MQQVLTESERVRRREHLRDVQAALKSGQTLEEFQAAHEARVERWVQLFYSEMSRLKCDDPAECLPQLMAKLEESCIAAVRHAAEKVARAEVEKTLRKAITP